MLDNSTNYVSWLKHIASAENNTIGDLNYIFCSDEYLLDINRQYLNHDFYTDVIGFPTSQLPDPVSGDIFISIDRIKENAVAHEASFHEELLRVMSHGILHFLGYMDKSEDEARIMRDKENEMIQKF